MQQRVNLPTLETLQNISGHAPPVSQMSIFNGQELIENVISQGIIPEGKEEEFQDGSRELAGLEAEYKRENKIADEILKDVDPETKYHYGEQLRKGNQNLEDKYQRKKEVLDDSIGTRTFSKIFDGKPSADENDVIKQYMASKGD